MNWYKKTQLDYPLEDPPLYGDSDYKQKGGKIIHMSPDDFLKQVRFLKIDEISRDNIEDLKVHMQRGFKLDPPIIYLQNGDIIDHDGRHRAVAAKEMGIQDIPVIHIDVS